MVNLITISGAITCILTFIYLFKYLNVSLIKKDEVIYKIKDTRKSKYLFLFIGYFLLLGFFLIIAFSDSNILEKSIVNLILFEMMILWTVLELGDTIISKNVICKLWSLKIKDIKSFEFKTLDNKRHLFINKRNNTMQRIKINNYDEANITNILSEINISLINRD